MVAPESEQIPLLAPEGDRTPVARKNEPSKPNVARRFVQLFALGIVLIIAVQLSFLPRTSPSRDFRRWNNLRLTKTDVKRMFLVQSEIGKPDIDGSTIEKNLLNWLGELGNVNSKHDLALAASEAPEASEFLLRSIRGMNYDVESASYALPDSLLNPHSSCMRLKDTKTGRILYSANLKEPLAPTPAFFVFSTNGSVSGTYVYAHHGRPSDLDRLRSSDIDIRGKIIIFSHSPLDSDYSLKSKVTYAEKFGCAAVLVYDETETHSISRAYRSSTPHSHMPVSSRQIKPVLDTLRSSGQFAYWKYGPTPDEDTLELEISVVLAQKSLNATNIFATVEGVLNDAEIVIGASRDTLTSANPSSGQAILLELMRRFQYLKMYGWRPLRTIRFAFWDASRSGALGSSASTEDVQVFKPNLPVLAYINLDLDVVTGSHLTVDANPLLNHVIRTTAKSVPFPRNSKYLEEKRMEEIFDQDFGFDLDSSASEETSLWHLWAMQDKAHINNKLGNSLGSEHGVFQLSKNTPVVSVSYSPNPAFNESTYIPESNYYNLDWVTKHVDPLLELHGSLVRFIGLLTLSLGEHEVVEYKTTSYFGKVQEFFHDFTASNEDTLASWTHQNVSRECVGKTLLSDIKARNTTVEEVTFGQILVQTKALLHEIISQARVFDSYNQDVENLWTTDYPWFRMIRKIHIFAKFKFTNYKLLRLEKELNSAAEDVAETDVKNFHFMFESPQGVLSIDEEHRRGAFASLYEATQRGDLETLVRLIRSKYERLSTLARRIK